MTSNASKIQRLAEECQELAMLADSAWANWKASGETSHADWTTFQKVSARLSRKTLHWQKAMQK